MQKTTSKLLRATALLSASNPDAVERCGSAERFGVFVQAVPLVLTPLCGFVGAAYAVHDILSARSQATSLAAPLRVLLPAAAGLVYAFILFAIDWMMVRSLDGQLTGKSKAAVIAPRLLLAAFSALLISVPLKAVIFEDEIRKFLLDEKMGKKAAATAGSAEQLAATKEPLAAATANVARISERLRGTPDAPEFLEAKAAIASLEPALEGVTRRLLALQQSAELLERQLPSLDPVSPEYAALESRIAAARAAWNDRKAERASLASRLSAAHAQARRAEQEWRDGLRGELGLAEKERSDYSRTYQDLLRADQAERGRVSAELDAAYGQTGFVGKVVALTSLASQSRPNALLMLGVFSIFLLIDAAPALTKILSKRHEYQSALAAVSLERTDYINQVSNSRAALHARVVAVKTKAAEQSLENLETQLDSLGSALGPMKAHEIGREARAVLEDLR